MTYEVTQPNVERRWWNSYWTMYSILIGLNLRGKRVLVVGCGFGEDALRIAHMGAQVDAFDLSEASIAIATARAEKEQLAINFRVMPAEKLDYGDNSFDLVIARDILHHVDIPNAMKKIVRVAESDGLFLFNEIYTHSIVDKVRNSRLVNDVLYPRMKRHVYGTDDVYITEDERKLTEVDVADILASLGKIEDQQYFYFLATRLWPEGSSILTKLDRIIAKLAGPLGNWIAGRVMMAVRIGKA